MREVAEETGLDLTGARELTRLVDDHGGWSYTTIVAWAELSVGMTEPVLVGEQQGLTWVGLDEVAHLPLHPGFADAWPQVCKLIPRLNR